MSTARPTTAYCRHSDEVHDAHEFAGGIMSCPGVRRFCPDDGTCHHGCTTGCFRVTWCGPLSGVYPGDEWPADVRAAEASSDGVL